MAPRRTLGGESAAAVGALLARRGRTAGASSSAAVCGAAAGAATEEAEPEWEDVGGASSSGEDDEVVVVEDVAADPTGASRPAAKRPRQTREEREAAALARATHCLCLLARGRMLEGAADDPRVRYAVMRIVPERHATPPAATKATLKALATWWAGTTRTRPAAPVPVASLAAGSHGADGVVRKVVRDASSCGGVAPVVADEESLAVMLVAALRGAGYHARLAVACDPPKSEKKGQEEDGPPPSKRPRKGVPVAAPALERDARRPGPPAHWAEAHVADGPAGRGRWVSVDPTTGAVDSPAALDAGRKLLYVVGLAGGGAKDVTRRYTNTWSAVPKARGAMHGWLGETLAPLRDAERAAGGAPLAAALERDAREDQDFEARALTEKVPNAEGALKHHPLYVLEEHLSQHEVLWPRPAPVGFVNGKKVYPRSAVKALRTPMRWERECYRRVRPEEADRPAKRVAPGPPPGSRGRGRGRGRAGRGGRGRGRAAVAAEQEDERPPERQEPDPATLTRLLYGEWQTDAFEPERARDGKVPKNERGQVDLWGGGRPPPGTVHLPGRRVDAAARLCGVDYARAMTGFDRKSGRPLPEFDGVVVCAEDAPRVRAQHAADEAARAERLLAARTEEGAKRWRLLLASVWKRRQLVSEYGGGGDGGAGDGGAASRAQPPSGSDPPPPGASPPPRAQLGARRRMGAEVEEL